MKVRWRIYLVLSLLLSSVIPGTAQEKSRRIWIGAPYTEEGFQVIPLEIDDLSEVVAGDLDLVFDRGRFTVAYVRSTDLLNGFVLVYNVVGDTLKIAFASALPAAGSGAFLEVLVEDTGALPNFTFALLSLNGDQIPVEYETATAVAGTDRLPSGLRLGQNYPNPFNARTIIPVDLPGTMPVRLAIYDVAGQPVRVLVQGELPAGVREVVWDGRDEVGQEVSSGMYLCRMETDRFDAVRRMILVK